MRTAIEIARIVIVMALVSIAAVVLTPKGRIPLALRGLAKLLKRDNPSGRTESVIPPQEVPLAKRLLGFFLIILAFILAVIRL